MGDGMQRDTAYAESVGAMENTGLTKLRAHDVAIAAVVVGLDYTVTTDSKTIDRTRKEAKAIRCQIENIRKDLKADAVRWGQLVDKTAKEVTARVQPVETHCEKLLAEQERIKAEEALRAEQKRQNDLKAERLQQIASLNFSPEVMVEAEKYGYLSDSTLMRSTPDEWQNVIDAFYALARQLKQQAEDRARLEAERAELARQQAEQNAKLEAERAELARKKAEEDARLAAERAEMQKKLEAQQAELARQQAEMRAMQERMAAERAAIEAEARRQREVAEAEERKLREAAEAEARRQREIAEAEERRLREAAEAEERRQREIAEAQARRIAAEEALEARLAAEAADAMLQQRRRALAAHANNVVGALKLEGLLDVKQCCDMSYKIVCDEWVAFQQSVKRRIEAEVTTWGN
ncbi:MAG: hypothetical protein RIT02_2684 [Planctomycetota bacterium]